MSVQITDWQAMADAVLDQIRQFETQHGTGVRPAWVSEEIAILRDRAWRYQQKADIDKGPA